MFDIVLDKDFQAVHEILLKAMMLFTKLLLILILQAKYVWLLLNIKKADIKYLVMFSLNWY